MTQQVSEWAYGWKRTFNSNVAKQAQEVIFSCKSKQTQGIIQGVFEIGNRFWACQNRRPNFDKLTKTKIFTKPLIIITEPVIKTTPMYIKHWKPVF